MKTSAGKPVKRVSAIDPKRLPEAEVVLMNGPEQAVALAYTPGSTPVVVSHGSGKAADELLWCAQELGLPVFDCPALTGELFEDLQPDQEIPEALYRPVAQCLAMIVRNRPAPNPVRLVRTLGNPARGLSRRLRRRVDALLDDLEVAQVRVSVGRGEAAQKNGQAQGEGELTQLLQLHRHRIEVESGLILNAIEVQVDEAMPALDYRIRLREVDFARGTLPASGEFGPLLRDLYTVIGRHGWRLLGFRETEALLEGLKKRHPRLHRELFPHQLTIGALRQILRNLLKEGIPVRDLAGILEVVLESLPQASDPDQLTEFVRAHFAAYLSQHLSDGQGVLHAMVLDPGAENLILKSLRESSAALWLDLDLDTSLRLLASVARGLERAQREGFPVVVLSSPRPRRFLRRLLEPTFPDLPVLSYAEVAPLTEVRTLCTVSV